MDKLLSLVVVLVALTSVADGRAKMTKNGVYPERAETWARFAVLGVTLGSPLESVAGYTCGPPPGTDGFTTADHSCVKFLDAKCKGRATKIKHLRSTGDVPKGQACFMDEGSGATYFDRTFTSPPLSAVRLVGTDTTLPLIFKITYTFAADDLTDESNLGKALLAKYGKPTFKNDPTSWTWEKGDVRLRADCRDVVGPTGEYCSLTAEDISLDQTEHGLQDEANDAARKKNAPAAPAL